MELRDYIITKSNEYFHINPDQSETKIIHSRENYTPFPFIQNKKTLEDYIIYDMPSSFQVNVFESKDNIDTSITYNALFEVYYKEMQKKEPLVNKMHKQNFYQLIYVVDGHANVILENSFHCLSKGSFCITNKNVTHAFDNSAPFTVFNICFKPDFVEGLPLFQSKQKKIGTELSNFFKMNHSHSEQIDYLIFQPITSHTSNGKLIQAIFNEMQEKKFGYLDICKFTLQRLFYELQKPSHYLCLHTHFSPSQERTLFEETLKLIIDKKYKLSREDIGKALNYNGNYISRVFQKHAGITLARYIRDIVLSHAAHLLLNTNMPIKDIIFLIGYENKTVFYKNFKEKYGVNPGEYRKGFH